MINFSSIEVVADAVLFEGYMLYPYRPSSLKNQQRWNFGTLYPREFAEALDPSERWQLGAELLMEANEQSRLSARLRFLQLVNRPGSEPWQEGFVRARTLENLSLSELRAGVARVIDVGALSMEEAVDAPPAFVRKPREACLALKGERIREGLWKLSIRVANQTALANSSKLKREDVQDVSLVSAHLMLGLDGGTFISLLDPPFTCSEHALECKQDGVFPVLAGELGDRSRMLCSPIILYDYPQVAPESPGNFFDGTEMDEMLALRVLTLTDHEKEEMRRSDGHARAILERTESLSNDQLARVHGAIRSLRRIDKPSMPAEELDLVEQSFDPFVQHPTIEFVRVFGVELRAGDRVRLWPQKKADIMDLAMEGKIAFIEAIEQDLENNVQFAVVLEDDPGRDMGILRQAGHRFFFSPEEVEPLGLEPI